MKFVSDDGKYFSTIDACEKYEEEQAAKKSKRAARIKELEEAEKKYYDLYDKFVEDYGTDPYLKDLSPEWKILKILRDI